VSSAGVPKAPAAGIPDPAQEAPVRGRWLREVWASTIGKKVLVAASGAILALYVVVHALANLKVFQGAGGAEAPIDAYAEWLRTFGRPAVPREGVLWVVRAVLLLALVIHVVGVIQLAGRNYEARPPGNRATPRLRRTWASRTMLLTGVLLLAFIVFHVLQFTTATIQATPVIAGDVYANLYDAFHEWYFVLIYVGSMALLFLHLRHGIWSATQTIGIDKPNRNRTFRRFATGTAFAVAVAFAAVPLAFWTGVLAEPA
jgi:succinate dehydrogenase / fumarate reductase cytochrome b subunit